MFCSQCGTKLSENAKFCQKCGTAVNVQTPAVAQTPVSAPVSTPANNPSKPQNNAFTYVCAGIMGVMILLFFMPWIVSEGKSFSMFTGVINVIQLDIVPFFFEAILMWAVEVLLILALVFTLTKKRNPLGLVITSTSLTVFTSLFFWITDYAISFATSTIVHVLMLMLAVANLIFFIISRKADK